MPRPKQSLAEFAKEHPARHGSKTWVEANVPPELIEELRAGWKAGLRSTTIERWLKAEGYEATTSRLGSYFKKCPVE